MKKQGLFSRWFILPVILVAMVAALILGFTQASFNDVETSTASTATAWSSTNWTQTSQAQFNAGVLSSVNSSASADNIILATSAVNATLSPTTNTGSAWTNPARAYDNGGTGYANITSGSPSGSNIWGTYGFNAITNNITQVRVRYDAWSAGKAVISANVSPSAVSANTGAFTTTGGTAPVVMADSLNTTYTTGATNGGGILTFTFPKFNVPSASGNIQLHVVFLFRSAAVQTAATGAACITVGGTTYNGTFTAPPASSGTIARVQQDWTTNPKTGANWTVNDINGVAGSNNLTAFGVSGNDFNPDVNFYEVKAWVTYTEYNDEIRIDASWDGGTSWTATQSTVLTDTETTYWYDITSLATWNMTTLNNTNLRVRALAQSFDATEEIRLDWLPVEVIYQQFVASGTVASQVLNTSVTDSPWDGLFWDNSLAVSTNITFEVRARNTSFAASASNATLAWIPIAGSGNGTRNVISGLPAGQYKQWRATLTTTANISTPILQEVRLYYYGG